MSTTTFRIWLLLKNFLLAIATLLVITVLGLIVSVLGIGLNPDAKYSTFTQTHGPFFTIGYILLSAWVMQKMGQKKAIGVLVGYIATLGCWLFPFLQQLGIGTDSFFFSLMIFPSIATLNLYFGLFSWAIGLFNGIGTMLAAYAPVVLLVLCSAFNIFLYFQSAKKKKNR